MLINKMCKGFSLIEVMIAVAIVGILAAAAYPTYLRAVAKSNRSEAKAELYNYAQRLQRCYTTYSKFNDATNCAPFRQLTESDAPTSSGNQFYEMSFSTTAALDATHYTLVAKAIKAPQTKDTICAKLMLDQAGKKTANDTEGNDTTDKCW